MDDEESFKQYLINKLNNASWKENDLITEER
jgi:hypothetical protein